MSNGLELTGTGGSYLRVSGDRQEVERQTASRGAFEKRHGVKISAAHQYEDDMPRDLSAKRPDFQRMLKAVKAGRLQWVFIDHIDRFGFADEWELAKRLVEFHEAGCKLLDARDDDWTAKGLMSFFKVGLAGHASHESQVTTSHRSLGGMIVKARAGEWQGGPPKLGFDIACFDRATNSELWRVVWEGRDITGRTERKGKMRPVYFVRRLKVYPDGRTERMDGNVVFRTSKDTQMMRIVPTRDGARLAAAQGVFGRYAAEAVTFFDLAKWLNGLGIRNSFGNLFQSRDISKMLTSEDYLGYPTFSKRRNGRFHRVKGGNVAELEPELYGKDTANAPDDVIRSAKRWFEPLIDRPTWDAVQKKLGRRDKPKHAPKNPGLYLAGLVVCAGCGRPMVARADRGEYYCGTWDKCRTRGRLGDSPCLRNGVKQGVLEGYVERYLEETGRRLQLLTEDLDAGHLTGRLGEQAGEAWGAFLKGIDRLTDYLARHHPDDFAALLRAAAERHAEDERVLRDVREAPPGLLAEQLAQHPEALDGRAGGIGFHLLDDFPAECVDLYRSRFDPSAVEAELAKLKAEYDRHLDGWADLPTKRAKETAAARLAGLESRMEELEKQRQDAADLVVNGWREMRDLEQAVAEARETMRGESAAHQLRRRAESLRGLLCRIECEFVLTGKKGCGAGGAGSRLAAVSFVPVAGEGVRFDDVREDGRCRSQGHLVPVEHLPASPCAGRPPPGSCGRWRRRPPASPCARRAPCATCRTPGRAPGWPARNTAPAPPACRAPAACPALPRP
jgi:DNA invertase Pin-like site-specific DNA recombinase